MYYTVSKFSSDFDDDERPFKMFLDSDPLEDLEDDMDTNLDDDDFDDFDDDFEF